MTAASTIAASMGFAAQKCGLSAAWVRCARLPSLLQTLEVLGRDVGLPIPLPDDLTSVDPQTRVHGIRQRLLDAARVKGSGPVIPLGRVRLRLVAALCQLEGDGTVAEPL